MTGIFDWLTSAPSSMGGAAPQGVPGGPTYGYNRLGLIGAALQDAGASASGRPDGGAMLAQFQNLGMMANQARARQALAQAMQSGDPAAIQKARGLALASGVDLSPYTPKYMTGLDGNTIGIDPVTGKASVVYQAGPRVPRGFYAVGDGRTVAPIPGGPYDPAMRANLAAARRGVVPANAPAQQPPTPMQQPPMPMQPPAPSYLYDDQGIQQ